MYWGNAEDAVKSDASVLIAPTNRVCDPGPNQPEAFPPWNPFRGAKRNDERVANTLGVDRNRGEAKITPACPLADQTS